MRLDTFRDLCLAQPCATEGLPFGPTALVFKVGGKMFALLELDAIEATANLKCDPEQAVELRERYAGVGPGYHMNKTHWNTVTLASDVPDDEIGDMLRASYALVAAGLPRRMRSALASGRDPLGSDGKKMADA